MVRAANARIVPKMTPQEQDRVCNLWVVAGLGEHASVGSFARFVLHLLGVGAPPSLLREAIQAMQDEIEHATICFGIARSISGEAIGPGPMDLSGIVDHSPDARTMLDAAIIEGCFGETVAAHYAKVAAHRVQLPELRPLLSRIADDEARHAELSWRFVAWLLETRPELRKEAATCFARIFSEPMASDELDGPSLEQWGHLLPSSKRQVAATVIAEVIRPRAAALCEAR